MFKALVLEKSPDFMAAVREVDDGFLPDVAQGGGTLAGAGEVLVTGATGGVGSVAIALLSRLGHKARKRRSAP